MVTKLHFGPGPNWVKPDESWGSIDADGFRGDYIIDFNKFEGLPFADNSIECIYGSHIFEHISIFTAPAVFKECFRVLETEGCFRIVLPDVRKSIEQYLQGNRDFELFQRRERSLKRLMNVDEVSLFELLKGDFLSPSSQTDIFDKQTLAHQNAWDFDAIVIELKRAGFATEKITRSQFQQSRFDCFNFEGTYHSEANEADRSMYVDVSK
ncbi:MAG: methyltransferase domain-containing protein [Alkalimonas sp.]|nr:methyltransferase domain-containing protein [Alkalimonas sp.]